MLRKIVERRGSSPETLPNDRDYYTRSPAAKHALKDGSLNPEKTFFSRTINRKLKMQDTFTKVFPSYNHEQPTIFQFHRPVSQTVHVYPKRGENGQAMHKIDR